MGADYSGLAHITVHYFELDDAETEALFDRIADAAHDLDEPVTVGMEDCRCDGGAPWGGESDG